MMDIPRSSVAVVGGVAAAVGAVGFAQGLWEGSGTDPAVVPIT